MYVCIVGTIRSLNTNDVGRLYILRVLPKYIEYLCLTIQCLVCESWHPLPAKGKECFNNNSSHDDQSVILCLLLD
jgi:hypothetical protein